MAFLTIGNKTFTSNLIQGPLAGFSCAPFRQLFSQFTPPAYCVSEMISASDVIHKHKPNSRYLYRAAQEENLCYQLSGNNAQTLALAAKILQDFGANMIDLNCGCPKTKIRKKQAGSVLLDNLDHLSQIITAMKKAISIPLTVKIRVASQPTPDQNVLTAQTIEQAGADALIVHGRHWQDDYDKPCDYQKIQQIKQNINIPVIANGDINDSKSLSHAIENTTCDAYMISRAGTGKPWLYQKLTDKAIKIDLSTRVDLFMQHIEGLATLENEFKALLQSRRLLKYYFKDLLSPQQISSLYGNQSCQQLHINLGHLLSL